MPFFCLQRLLPTHFFHAIQSVQISWAYCNLWEIFHSRYDIGPFPVSVWTQTWQEFAKMKGLRRVKADLILSREMVHITWGN